jgi:hypothetical protein
MLVFGTALWMGWGALGGTSLSLGIAPLLSKKVSNTTIGAKITTIKPDPPESVNKVEQRQIPGTAGKFRCGSTRHKVAETSRYWFIFTVEASFQETSIPVMFHYVL